MTGFNYPEAREAFWWLLTEDRFTDDEIQVAPYFHLTADFGVDSIPAGQIMQLGGTEGFMERVDRVGVDFYAEGELAGKIAEAFRWRVTAGPLFAPGVGLLDRIEVETLPHDVPYPSDRINVSSAIYRVTTRPKFD